jgi:hypothetical protein
VLVWMNEVVVAAAGAAALPAGPFQRSHESLRLDRGKLVAQALTATRS